MLALFLAAAVLFSFTIAFADEWDDDEDFGDEEFEDDEFEEEEAKTDFRTIAGYDTGEKFTAGDFIYQLPDGVEGAVVISYTGTSAEMVIPEMLDDHPVVAIGDQAFNFLAIETGHASGRGDEYRHLLFRRGSGACRSHDPGNSGNGRGFRVSCLRRPEGNLLRRITEEDRNQRVPDVRCAEQGHAPIDGGDR